MSEAWIGTSSTSIPVVAPCGEALEPADAQSFVESTITFKVPQIENGEVSQLENLRQLLAAPSMPS